MPHIPCLFLDTFSSCVGDPTLSLWLSLCIPEPLPFTSSAVPSLLLIPSLVFAVHPPPLSPPWPSTVTLAPGTHAHVAEAAECEGRVQKDVKYEVWSYETK